MRELGRHGPPQFALRRAAEDHAELTATEHTLGLALQLAVAVAETVAAHQDMPVALGELLDSLSQGAYLHFPDDRARDLGGALVLDELPELRAVAVRGE